MTDAQLFSDIATLPATLKAEVADFVAFLSQRKKKTDDSIPKHRRFGCAKGLITLSPDFDEPLEDFKEYM